MRRTISVVTTALALAAGGLPAQAPADVKIRLERASRGETIMARELEAVLGKYDTGPWTMTREVVIDERAIPHSHPVLTIHTRHIGDEELLLATYLHEQLHWLEDARPTRWREAMREFRALYPTVPSSRDGGARDDESTYRHLLVCDMELQAVSALLGRDRARAILARITHYQWIYDKVLNDPRVRDIAIRHGFDVSAGVTGR